MRETFELISLVLTAPTLVLAILVVHLWGRPALSAWLETGDLGDRGWLLLGVTLGFLGSIGDNAYWGATWALAFLDHPDADTWFQWGCLPNIGFRQGLGIAAAYCHCRGASTGSAAIARLLSRAVAASVVLAVMWLAALLVWT